MRMPYPTITWDVLDRWIENGTDMVLVDLRTGPEYEAAHLRGAVSLPYGELGARYRELPAEKLLVFYCSRGSSEHEGLRPSQPDGLPGGQSGGRTPLLSGKISGSRRGKPRKC